MRQAALVLVLVLASLLCGPLAQVANPIAAPLVIAHRGASGYLPEHTLAGYELTIKTGADFIEPDLQMTSDGVLVAIHDDSLPRTTNVTDLFAVRGLTAKAGCEVVDFSLAEIKTLTVKETTTGATTCSGFTPTFAELRVPTFDEVIALAKAQSTVTGRTIGIYPQAKQADPAMEDKILATLARERYTSGADKVFVQSFGDATMKRLADKQRALGMRLPLVQLGVAVTLPDGAFAIGVPGGRTLSLPEVAAYASRAGVAIGNPKFPLGTRFVEAAHAAGLPVHGWTFAKADPAAAADEYEMFFEMGLDGVFSNYSDLAVASRNAFVAARK